MSNRTWLMVVAARDHMIFIKPSSTNITLSHHIHWLFFWQNYIFFPTKNPYKYPYLLQLQVRLLGPICFMNKAVGAITSLMSKLLGVELWEKTNLYSSSTILFSSSTMSSSTILSSVTFSSTLSFSFWSSSFSLRVPLCKCPLSLHLL